MQFETKKQYAMKIIRKEIFDENKKLERWVERELELLHYLDHPKIVKLVEMFEDEMNFYVIMELMEGGDLFDYLNIAQKLSEK